MWRLGIATLLAASASALAQAPRAVPTRVITEFGGPADDPAIELVRVTSVVRTDDGRFVVVNARPLGVRIHGRAGQFERHVGREGSGPGEYRGSVLVAYWPGDSVAVYSSSRRRWMLFRLNGSLVREWALSDTETPPGDVALYGGAFVRYEFRAQAQCHAARLARATPASGPLHEALIDGGARTWTRQADRDEWRLYDANGALLGSASVPARFVPMQAQGSYLIGIRPDEDDFPHIVVLEPGLPAPPARPAQCEPGAPASERAAEVRRWTRNATTAAEAFFSDHGRYPREFRDLPMSIPSGFTGQITLADSRNYWVTVRETATGYRCIVSMGAIPGFPAGLVACG